jgi:adenine-specific DNA-methyltransferase
LTSAIEQRRRHLSKTTATKTKSLLGQFFTPESTAKYMAGFFSDISGDCRLLDAGAGIGSLSAAFLDRWRSGEFNFKHLEIDAFELDAALLRHLAQTLEIYDDRDNCLIHIHDEDFVHAAVGSLTGDFFSRAFGPFTHAILNPPYKKISSNSAHRRALRRVGIETVNLYSAFVALALELLSDGGEVVAIIPRSFCNGPYYRPFREFILERSAIRHIHLYDSRKTAFKDDGVLQENIIIHLERGGVQGLVNVSTSTDDTFCDLVTHAYDFERIVRQDDPEHFIHVPSNPDSCAVDSSSLIRHTLDELGINVSTGPVIDFRLRKHLRDMPELNTVPLLHPCHFSGGAFTWPVEASKKSNAIELSEDTEKWLYPNDFYCVVRRFSSKEEKHRIVASVVDPALLLGANKLGFENHLNVFHQNKHGLPEFLARGLAVFLNSTMVDQFFRRFSGHTQVNATDLRLMKYPCCEVLLELGAWAAQMCPLAQEQIDEKLMEMIDGN